MAIELLLLAVNMNFIAFSYYLDDLAGQVFVFFIVDSGCSGSSDWVGDTNCFISQPPVYKCSRFGSVKWVMADS